MHGKNRPFTIHKDGSVKVQRITVPSCPMKHECAHCQSKESPLWRKGLNQETLCNFFIFISIGNACGLYVKQHSYFKD